MPRVRSAADLSSSRIVAKGSDRVSHAVSSGGLPPDGNGRAQPVRITRRDLLASTAALAAAGLAAGDPGSSLARDIGVLDPPASSSGLWFSCKYGMTQGDTLEQRLAAARDAGLDGVDFDAAAGVTPEQLRAAARSTGVFIHNAINHDHWRIRLTSPDAAIRSRALANLEHCLRVSAAAGGSGVLIVVGKAEDGPEGPDRARDEIRRAIPLAAVLGQRILFENVWNGLFYEDDGSRTQSVRPLADYIDSFQSPWVGSFFDLGNHARYGDVATWIRELGPRIVKLDIKGYSNARADAEGKWKGFVDITAGDIDWAAVRGALRDIGFTGWVSAEVEGGDVARLRLVLDQMKRALIG
jgi:L-ribulose-5-phosphate 3-epimerase